MAPINAIATSPVTADGEPPEIRRRQCVGDLRAIAHDALDDECDAGNADREPDQVGEPGTRHRSGRGRRFAPVAVASTIVQGSGVARSTISK